MENSKTNDQSKSTIADELHSNDGMTAASARASKTIDPHQNFEFDSSEKPGKKYNVNDQAYSQSSKEDFVKTVSNFESEDVSRTSAILNKDLEND